MKHFILALKLLVFSYLGYLLFFLATAYEPSSAGFSPPFTLWVLDTINLYIHEAGHLFLSLFGRFINILGGSLVQILIPLALLIVTWRQNPGQTIYPAFWLGESMVNVSVYIQDAPFRKLRLIGKGLIHDWWWLLNGNEAISASLSEAVFLLGLAICLLSLGAGVFYAVRVFREEGVPLTPSPAWSKQFPGRVA